MRCCDGVREHKGSCEVENRVDDSVALTEVGSTPIKFLEWNVHWNNQDVAGLAGVIKDNTPDIVGLCELTVYDVPSMARALEAATNRPFALQPGRGAWNGYGTDIFYDSDRWQALEGGVERVECNGTTGGPRGANWVVLSELATGRKLITGGLHTTYCEFGCDAVHECEIGALYTKFEEAKGRHGNAPVVWMGDLNREKHSYIVQRLLQGWIGAKQVFPVVLMADTSANTYYTGGPAIDHIFGEASAFSPLGGGRTEQGVTGQLLQGADHFPIYATAKLS